MFQNNKYTYFIYPINIIYKLGFDINDLNIKLEKNNFIENLCSTIQYYELYKHEINYKYKLKNFKKNVIKTTLKKKVSVLNKILNFVFGLKIINKNDQYFLNDKNVWDDIKREKKIMPKELKIFNN